VAEPAVDDRLARVAQVVMSTGMAYMVVAVF